MCARGRQGQGSVHLASLVAPLRGTEEIIAPIHQAHIQVPPMHASSASWGRRDAACNRDAEATPQRTGLDFVEDVQVSVPCVEVCVPIHCDPAHPMASLSPGAHAVDLTPTAIE